MTYATAAPATAGGNANSPVSALADVVAMPVRFRGVREIARNCYRLQSISASQIYKANQLTSSQPVCQNCTTSTTPLWRRDESGSVLCNACGLFLKLHGRPRPISLKTDVIKSRNRVKTGGPGARKKVRTRLLRFCTRANLSRLEK